MCATAGVRLSQRQEPETLFWSPVCMAGALAVGPSPLASPDLLEGDWIWKGEPQLEPALQHGMLPSQASLHLAIWR